MKVRYDPLSKDLFVTGKWGGNRLLLRKISLQDSSVHDLNPPIVLGPAKTALPTFDLSKDGRLVLFVRENIKGNIWLLQTNNGSF